MSQMFVNVVLAICEKIQQKHLATVKLNKLIWLIDKEAMIKFGESITGVEYIRKIRGPVPKNNIFMLNEMKDAGILEITEEQFDDGESPTQTKRTYASNSHPDFSQFPQEKVQLINDVIEKFGKEPTRYLVYLSHDNVWAAYDDNETIPLEAYCVSSTCNDDDYKRHTKNLIKEAEREYAE